MFRNILRNALVVQPRRFASEATFEFGACPNYLLEDGPATSATVTSEQAVKYYTEMQTIRRMELKADQLYKQKGNVFQCIFWAKKIDFGSKNFWPKKLFNLEFSRKKIFNLDFWRTKIKKFIF